MAVPHAQIASLKMADGPMGIAGSRVDERDVSILTPAPIALGATWDISLVARIGQLVGGEAIRTAINLVLAPNLNLARSPLAGRCFEYFGEDPFHVGLLGTAWASGIQSQGIGAIAKHLVCNDSETGRDVMNAVVDERTLHEVYLLPFEMAAKDDCAGILTAYNRINGAWCSEASDVIVKIAKEQWGYRGMFMSDWFGTHSTVGSLNGGLDLEMPGPARFLGAKAMQAVEQGETAADRVHDAALRIARTAVRFSNASGTPLSKDASKALLIETAAAGFTLLRNKGALLPLVPGRQQRIAVIGPNASMPCFQGGTFAKIALKSDAVTPLDAIMARYEGHAIIEYAPGVDPQPRLPRMSVVPKRDLGDNCHSGMTIDYFADQDFDSAPVASETRNTNSLTWFFGVHDAGAFQQPAGTLAQGIFTATHGGDHIFYLGGTGAVRMLIDGREILRRDDIPAAKDVMGRLKSGEADSVAIRLIAGQKIEVKAEMRYSPARAQGLLKRSLSVGGVRSAGLP